MRFTCEDLLRGCIAFVQNEDDDRYYRRAARAIEERYGQPETMKDAISELLNIWHRGFYRFGDFSREALQDCIVSNLSRLSDFRALNLRNIDLANEQFESSVKDIFEQFMDALAGKNSKFKRRSPVAAAKALNLLAPALFPLWDEAISLKYGCWWKDSFLSEMKYISFMKMSQECCRALVDKYQADYGLPDAETAESELISYCINGSRAGYTKSLLKLVDEYNYAKFTKKWI